MRQHLLRFSGVLFFIIRCTLTLKANASPEFAIDSPAAWVQVIDAPKELNKQPNKSSFGVYYLLVEQQIKKEAGAVMTYTHVIKKVTHTKGLEQNSSIEIEFDPLNEFITLHAIQVRRDNQVIHHLSPDKIKILQREKGLEDNIYNGYKSLSIILDDIRVGDIIDYCYTRQDSDPLSRDTYYTRIYLSSNIPVDRLRHRILWPEELISQPHNTNIQPQVTPKQEYQEYLWDIRDLPQDRTENGVPAGYNADPFIEIGTALSWHEVALTALKPYQPKQHLSPELQDYIAQIKSQRKNKAELFIKVIRFIQDEIRYMGIEDRLDRLLPDDPTLVFKRRFGDCKDKTLLALTILKAIGIEAYPALVHTRAGKFLDEPLPSLFHFNHVIVVATLNGKTYWIDPTHSLQSGDLAHFTQPDYGCALILDEKTSGLTRMPQPKTLEPHYKIYETIDVSKGENASGHLIAKRVYRANEADSMRRTIHDMGPKEVAKSYLEIYQKYYLGAKEKKEIRIIDDEETNQITIIGEYELPVAWKHDQSQKRWIFWYYANGFKDYLGSKDLINRQQPLALDFPLYDYKEITVLLPGIDWDLPPESYKMDHPSLNFESKQEYKEGILKITYNYKHLKDHIPSKEINSYIEISDKIYNTLGGSLSISDPAPQLVKSDPVPPTVKKGPINWIMAFLIAIIILVSLFVAVKMYRFTVIHPTREASTRELNAVKGWLLLIMLLLGFESLFIPFNIWLTIEECVLDYGWLSPLPGKNSIDPQFLIILKGCEHILTFVLSILWIPLMILLLKRKKSFPYLYLRCMAICLVQLFLALCYYYLSIDDSGQRRFFIGMLIVMIIKELIVGWYFLISKRVKAVFIRA